MKGISAEPLSTSLQLSSQAKLFHQKSNCASETEIYEKETPSQAHIKTEKPASFDLPKFLFGECFQNPTVSFKEEKAYRKLQYKSLDKRNFRKLSKTQSERKTLSLKDSFLSFGKEKISKQFNGQLLKSIHQYAIADMIGSHRVEKCNVLNPIKNAGRNSLMVSTMNSINGGYEKYQSCFNSKLFLSQECKIPNISSPVILTKNVQTQNIHSKLNLTPESCEQVDRTRRLSTNDSIKLKGNEQISQFQANKNVLEIGSILCESIDVNKQDVHKQNFFEFDHMKDSLIDKLNLFRKEESFIESKKKIFIRSQKNRNQESPRFCGFDPSGPKFINKSKENEEQVTEMEKVDSKQTIEQRITRKKYKTLDECAYTIVSKYNKSSEQKSILQESNIVFQASKMCVDPNDLNINLPTFSDTRIVFDNQQKENYENEKSYSSFIHEFNLNDKNEMKSLDGDLMKKKVNRAFLRTKKSSSQKEITCKEKDEMSIRFDLDTFIEYGPL